MDAIQLWNGATYESKTFHGASMVFDCEFELNDSPKTKDSRVNCANFLRKWADELEAS